MLKSILIGLDGSEYSKEAAKVAVVIAKNTDCKLFGLGIIDAPSIFDPSPGVAGSIHYKKHADRAQYDEAKKRVKKSFDWFEEICAQEKVQCKIKHREGSPLDEFIREAVGYDVIMFGQKTYFEQEKREGPCGTLLRILKDTPRPVLVAPRKIEYGLEQPVVVAFDGSMASSRAMQIFTLLSYDDTRCDIHLVTVSDEEEEGLARQDKASLFLENWYGRKPVKAVLQGKRSDAILEYAGEVNARLLVMGAYGRSGLRSLFFGSVTRDILEKAKCLLCLYH